MNDITSQNTDTDVPAITTSAPKGPGRKKRTKLTVPDAERWAFSVDEAAAKAGFSRAKMWDLVRRRIISAHHHGGRTWITADDLRDFLTNPPGTP